MLAVAQGIETALALRTACPELAVAATLTAASLSAFIPPARVTRLLIARDNHTASARAAERLLARCRDRALTVGVIASEGRDFNDDLLVHGPEALGERIRQAPSAAASTSTPRPPGPAPRTTASPPSPSRCSRLRDAIPNSAGDTGDPLLHIRSRPAPQASPAAPVGRVSNTDEASQGEPPSPIARMPNRLCF